MKREALLFIVLLLISTFSLVPVIYGDTLTIHVTIGSLSPFIIDTDILIFKGIGDSDDAQIDLEDFTTIQITCNATINDPNGFADVVGLNGSLFDTSLQTTLGAVTLSSLDNNTKYVNTSCSLVAGGAGTTVEGECQFTVQYYANNATWSCNLTAYDGDNNVNSSDANTTVNILTAINLPATMSFGTLNLGDNWTNVTNITNSGNIGLGIRIYGYANNQTNSTAAFNCTTTGGVKSNISLRQMQYNVSQYFGAGTTCRDFGFGLNAWNLTNRSNEKTWNTSGNRWKLFQRQNDAFESVNTTCWSLRIPQAGEETVDPAGVCTGILSFVACQSGLCGDDIVTNST